MSLITFYIQNALNKLTHYSPATVLHTFSNGFLQQAASSDPLQCILQLGNSIGYSMAFVAIASCKDVG